MKRALLAIFLLPSLARADASVSDGGRPSWVARCVAALERARDLGGRRRPVLRRAAIKPTEFRGRWSFYVELGADQQPEKQSGEIVVFQVEIGPAWDEKETDNVPWMLHWVGHHEEGRESFKRAYGMEARIGWPRRGPDFTSQLRIWQRAADACFEEAMPQPAFELRNP
jgi:hypothetical protein